MIKVLTVAPITNAQLDGILIVGFKAGLWQKNVQDWEDSYPSITITLRD